MSIDGSFIQRRQQQLAVEDSPFRITKLSLRCGNCGMTVRWLIHGNPTVECNCGNIRVVDGRVTIRGGE